MLQSTPKLLPVFAGNARQNIWHMTYLPGWCASGSTLLGQWLSPQPEPMIAIKPINHERCKLHPNDWKLHTMHLGRCKLCQCGCIVDHRSATTHYVLVIYLCPYPTRTLRRWGCFPSLTAALLVNCCNTSMAASSCSKVCFSSIAATWARPHVPVCS